MARRTEQMNEVLRTALGECFLKFFEFPLGSLVTITSVEVSQDHENAIVWISVFPHKFRASVLKQLDRAKRYCVSLISKRVKIEHIPQLQFKLDTTQDHVEDIEKLFVQIEGDIIKPSSDE